MKLYLDENLSPRFRIYFDSSILEIFSAKYMGWYGKKNGELLTLLFNEGFRGIISSDKLMYSDDQLKKFNLHFLLIQSISDTPIDRIPLLGMLNHYLLEHFALLSEAKCSKILITDGIANKNFQKGVNLIWIL